ncbi:hypothetical protein AAHB33_16625 [Paenarthrobacter sp. S56]|uniref:hypothetical protein n=1 Tax=Paenarthrobacter sp. S56 TaxID=3138179 RepID=UPI00321A3CDE
MTALATAAVVLFALVSCGMPPTTEQPNNSATPTAACPRAGTEPQHGNCVPYDGDAAMAQNEMYRQRGKVSPEMQAQLNQRVEPARKALEALTRPASESQVKAAFQSMDLNEVQTDEGLGGVRFGVSVPGGGCLYGIVPTKEKVTIQAGGSTLDGGCLEMVGH